MNMKTKNHKHNPTSGNISGLALIEEIEVYDIHVERADYVEAKDLKFRFATAALNTINVKYDYVRKTDFNTNMAVKMARKAKLNESLSITEAFARRASEEVADFNAREIEAKLQQEHDRSWTEDETRFHVLSKEKFTELGL